MFIFFIIAAAAIIGIHKSVMSAVENYDYGYGTHEEWREFERQFQYDEVVKF